MFQRLRECIRLYREYHRIWPQEPRFCVARLAWNIAGILQRVYEEETRRATFQLEYESGDGD
jgi:hypothetical protein